MIAGGYAWAAGLFEGEGSIYLDDADVRKRNGKLRIGMSLSSTDHDVIQHFCAVVNCGKVYGPYEAKGGTRLYWTWHLRDAGRIREVFLDFLPYLGLRRCASFEEVLAAKADFDVSYQAKPIGRPPLPLVHVAQMEIR